MFFFKYYMLIGFFSFSYVLVRFLRLRLERETSGANRIMDKSLIVIKFHDLYIYIWLTSNKINTSNRLVLINASTLRCATFPQLCEHLSSECTIYIHPYNINKDICMCVHAHTFTINTRQTLILELKSFTSIRS